MEANRFFAFYLIMFLKFVPISFPNLKADSYSLGGPELCLVRAQPSGVGVSQSCSAQLWHNFKSVLLSATASHPLPQATAGHSQTISSFLPLYP